MLKVHDLPMGLGSAFRLLHRCTEACCKKYGITAKQFVLLVLLAEEDGTTQQELAKRAASDQNTIRAMLILLEKLGMIKREQHVTDGRKHHIIITQKGLKTYKNALKDSEAIRDHMYANFSIDELKAFQAFLNRIIVTLEDFSLKHNNSTDD